MNMKTTALVAILVVSAVAMIGAGYAAYTGTTTSNDNAIGEIHLYVTNGTGETKVITFDPDEDQDNGKIVYDTIYTKGDTKPYQMNINLPNETEFSDGDISTHAADDGTPQVFYNAYLNFNGEAKKNTDLYLKLGEQASTSILDPEYDVRTETVDAVETQVPHYAHLMVKVIKADEDVASAGTWYELNATADAGTKVKENTYIKIKEFSESGDDPLDGIKAGTENAYKIYFAVYGDYSNTTGPLTLNSLEMTFLVVTDMAS